MKKLNSLKTSVTVGIAAYNSERNIKNLLTSLAKQKQKGFEVKKIIVYSDYSKDNTISEAGKVKSKIVKIINSRKNNGFSFVVKYFLKINKSDILIILNDDIKISSSFFLSEIIKKFTKNKNIGLVSGNVKPIKGESFVEKASESSFKVYEKLRKILKNGNSIYTCDGKVLAFSKNFIRAMVLPDDNSKLGNVDNFMYFYCLSKGFEYKNAKKAVVYYKNVNNIREYVNFFLRIHSMTPITERFGDLVEKEYKKPMIKFVVFQIEEALKNPIGSLFVFLISLFVFYRSRKKQKFNYKWVVAASSKF